MQKTLNYIVENEELNQKLMSAKTFEEVYDLFKSVKPDITEEEFENFFIDFFKELETYGEGDAQELLGVESLDQENLEKVSGGKISQRVVAAALASLVFAPSVVGAKSVNTTSKKGTTTTISSKQTSKEEGIKSKVSKKFGKLKNWFMSLPLWGKITIPTALSIPSIGFIIHKVFGNKQKKVEPPIVTPVNEITEANLKDKIEELLNSRQTTNDDIDGLCDKIELAGLRDKAFDIMCNWFTNGEKEFVQERATNENANAIVKYFATHGTEEQKGKYAELQGRLQDFVNPPAHDPKADEITKENLAIKIEELLLAEYTDEAAYKKAAEKLCKKLDANDIDLMNEARRILKEKFDNSGENAEIEDRVKYIIEYFAQNGPENMRSNFSDLLLPKDPPPVPPQAPTNGGRTVERDFKDLTADNAWSVIEAFLNSPAKENPENEADYLKEATELRASIEKLGAVNQIRGTIYNNLLGWFRNGKPEGEFDFNRASDARARYLVGYFANAGQEDGREQYKELDSQLNQYILIERLTDQTQSGNEKSGAERLIKLLALARLGNAKVVNAKYDSDLNRDGDHDEANRAANDFKVYSGYLTDLFAYGNTVVFDYNTNVQTQLTDLGHILDDNYESSGVAEVSSHGLELTNDGTRVKEAKLNGPGQVNKFINKLVNKTAVGAILPINIIPNITPNGTFNNALKSLVERLSDTKSGMFAKLEVAMNQGKSKYGYRHSAAATSERITATAAARDFAPFAKRDGIHVEFDKLTVGEIKRAVDEWYTKYNALDVKDKKDLLRTLTNPTADRDAVSAVREIAFPGINATLNRSDAKVKQALVHKVNLNDGVRLVVFKYPDGKYSFWLEVEKDRNLEGLDLSDFVKKALNAKITEAQMQQVLIELQNHPNFGLDKGLTLKSIGNDSGLYFDGYSELVAEEYKNQEENAKKLAGLYAGLFNVLRKTEPGMAGRTLYSFEFLPQFYEKHKGNTATSEWDKSCSWATDGLKTLIDLTVQNKSDFELADEYIAKLNQHKSDFISWREVFECSKEWYLLNPSTSSEFDDTVGLLTFNDEIKNEIIGFINANSSGGHIHSEQGTSGVADRMHPKKVEISEGSSRHISHTQWKNAFNWHNLQDRSVREMMIRRIFYFRTGINLPNRVALAKSWSDTLAGAGASAVKGVVGAAKGLGRLFGGLFGGGN